MYDRTESRGECDGFLILQLRDDRLTEIPDVFFSTGLGSAHLRQSLTWFLTPTQFIFDFFRK